MVGRKWMKLRFKNLKIRHQVIILFVVLVANSAIIIMGLFLWFNGYIFNNQVSSIKGVHYNIHYGLEEYLTRNGILVHQTVRGIEELDGLERKSQDEYRLIFKTLLNVTESFMVDMMNTTIYVPSTDEYFEVYGKQLPHIQTIVNKYQLKSKEYQKPFYTPIWNEEGQEYYQLIHPINNQEGKVMGYYIASFSVENLNNIVKEAIGEQKTYFSFYHQGQVMSTNMDFGFDKEKEKEALEHVGSNGYFTTEGSKRYYIQGEYIDETGWAFIMYTPAYEMFQDIFLLIGTFLIMTLITGGFGIRFFMVIKESISRPIDEIVLQLDEMGQHHEAGQTKAIKVNATNEISQIVAHMNAMMDKNTEANKMIIEGQKRLYETELKRREAEISFYESQINPHFLYNNLEFIRSLGAIYGVEAIEKISVALSKVFRYSVKADQMVTIKEELQCITNYFAVMNLRFPDKYRLRLSVANKDEDYPMPKMILQPIMENIFKHGFIGKRNRGCVMVKGHPTEDGYELQVIDTGRGIAKEIVEELNGFSESEESGVGLINVHRRLQLQYDESYGLRIESKEGYYTKVRIKIGKYSET